MIRSVVLAVVLVVAMSGCKRPSSQACEEALRNYATLLYWEKAEVEIAAAPPAERDALRTTKLAERDKLIAEGMMMAVSQCRAARDFDGVKCMKEAHTPAQARACRKPWN